MSALKIASLVVMNILIGSLATPYIGGGIKNCPSQWFLAEFASLVDVVAPRALVSPIIDTDLSFFKDIMLFTDEEIERATQDAMTFFDARFGLDFSQSSPDELGQRTIGNATLAPYFLSPDVRYTITINRWIVDGRFINRCYENRDGGFLVSFTGDHKLFGAYGGQDGRLISAGDALLYGFYNIPVCEQQPIVIQYNSGTPFRFEPVDGFAVINCELHHRVLGEGVAQGVFRVVPTGEEDMYHLTIRNLFTFPRHPGLN